FYVILLFPLAYLFVFNYVPMYGLQIAFKRFAVTKGIAGSPWVGLANFARFVSAYNFKMIIWNTVGISVYAIVAGFPFPLLLALLLNEVENRHFKKTVQMVSYAPHFISTIVIVAMLNQMLSLRFGIVNNCLELIGLERVNFMAEAGMFKSIYVFSGIWQQTGYKAIIYIAALSAIDPTLYEAATIDGAGKLQKIRHIDFPSLLPTAVILLIMDMCQFPLIKPVSR
ncbi:MAG: ABC transporter permease subunit, partial [Anaerolineaceae bacterium]